MRIVVATILLSSLAGVVQAQGAAGRCTPPDSTGEWYHRQREWLSDPSTGSDSALRNELLAAAALDPGVKLSAQVGWQRAGATSNAASPAADAAVVKLQSMARTRGGPWPTKSMVGAAGVRAAWLLAQRDTALQRVTLRRMMESGPEEALGADVAVLEDRVRIQSGRKQLYGTQLREENGQLVPAPMEDSAHVDMRREGAGLPPLAAAICAAKRAPAA